jgi:hypothetical protein
VTNPMNLPTPERRRASDRRRNRKWDNPRRGVSPWTIIGWFFVVIIALVILANVIVGCAAVSLLSEAAGR